MHQLGRLEEVSPTALTYRPGRLIDHLAGLWGIMCLRQSTFIIIILFPLRLVLVNSVQRVKYTTDSDPGRACCGTEGVPGSSHQPSHKRLRPTACAAHVKTLALICTNMVHVWPGSAEQPRRSWRWPGRCPKRTPACRRSCTPSGRKCANWRLPAMLALMRCKSCRLSSGQTPH